MSKIGWFYYMPQDQKLESKLEFIWATKKARIVQTLLGRLWDIFWDKKYVY